MACDWGRVKISAKRGARSSRPRPRRSDAVGRYPLVQKILRVASHVGNRLAGDVVTDGGNNLGLEQPVGLHQSPFRLIDQAWQGLEGPWRHEGQSTERRPAGDGQAGHQGGLTPRSETSKIGTALM